MTEIYAVYYRKKFPVLGPGGICPIKNIHMHSFLFANFSTSLVYGLQLCSYMAWSHDRHIKCSILAL